MTIIAKGTEINGGLTIEGNVRIDGDVNGDLTATGGLEVGKTGRIRASSIDAKTAIIHGHVEGKVTALQHVVLGSKSTLKGDLQTKSLVIEEGAVFHGNSTMSDIDAGSDDS